MRLQNTSGINTNELRAFLYKVAKVAEVSTRGLYVWVQKGYYGSYRGICYDADFIYRKGEEIPVNGYIKLRVFPEDSLLRVAKTFAHELSHLKDARETPETGKRRPV